MSHRPLRKQNDCLNCGAVIKGRYCHICGQENVEPKESLWHLVTHFVYDITHFDGKFFSTVKNLLFRPGFLPAEYVKGKRMSYLNPIKMYVFTSAFFFIFFFSVVNPIQKMGLADKKQVKTETEEDLSRKREDLIEALKKIEKDSGSAELRMGIETIDSLLAQIKRDSLKNDTSAITKDSIVNNGKTKKRKKGASFSARKYRSLEHYDSAQQALPVSERDGWLIQRIRKKEIELDKKYGYDRRQFAAAFIDKFFHSFPQILFVSLPLMALVLKLIYIRRRGYYVAEHAIYLVHLYCALFILIFLSIITSMFSNYKYFDWLGYVQTFLVLYSFWYVYKSMRNFYQQSRMKTVNKYFILLFTASFVISMLFAVFGLLSIFTV